MRQKIDKTMCDKCGESKDTSHGQQYYQLTLYIDQMNRVLDFCSEKCMREYLIERKSKGEDDQSRLEDMREKRMSGNTPMDRMRKRLEQSNELSKMYVR